MEEERANKAEGQDDQRPPMEKLPAEEKQGIKRKNQANSLKEERNNNRVPNISRRRVSPLLLSGAFRKGVMQWGPSRATNMGAHSEPCHDHLKKDHM